jgi:hypothetical protein
MTKTIKQINFIPGHTHPAIGGLYQVEFEDGTQDKVYAETFFHQVSDWNGEDESQLAGKTLDTEDAYWNFQMP